VNISVKSKLLTLLGCILAGFFLVFAVDALERQRTRHVLELERLAVGTQLEVLNMRRQEKNYFLRHDPASLLAVDRRRQDAAAAIEAIRARDPGHDPLCDTALDLLGQYQTAFAAITGRQEGGGSDDAAFVAAARSLEPVIEELRGHYEAKRHGIAETAASLSAAIRIAAVVLVALAAWGVFRSVAGPLAAIGRHARLVARGEHADLDPDAFHGEFHELAVDIACMERHLASTILDLSAKEREAANEARRARKARKQAEDLSRVKSNFLNLVSHEFKTPLTSMLGFAQVMHKRLERGQLAEIAANRPEVAAECARFRDNLHIMLDEGRRLAGLIDSVLELAALESGGTALVLGPADAAELVDRAVAPYLETMGEKRLAFLRDIPRDMPPLLCDPERMVYVLRHLFSNAVKFTQAGHIACRVRRQDDMAVIRVEDTGQGIPPAMREAVFEKFLQLGDQTTGKMPGLGIGLAASRTVVECHGGRIDISGEPGRGSAVAVAIPLATTA